MKRQEVINKRLGLEETALRQAAFRGHDMSPFATAAESDKSWSEAYCLKCEMYVQVNAKPQAIGNLQPMEITGAAAVINCPKVGKVGVE